MSVARDSDHGAAGAAPTVPPAVAEERERIDELDNCILALLNERQSHVLAIRTLKEEAGLPRYDPDREGRLLARLAARNDLDGGLLAEQDIRAIYAAILQCSRGKV